MTKTIVLDGKEYYLVEKKEKEPEIASKSLSEAIWNDYAVTKIEKRIAVPEVDDYREKFKEKRLSLKDLPRRQTKILDEIPEQDGDLNKFGDLVIGDGTSQEIM